MDIDGNVYIDGFADIDNVKIDGNTITTTSGNLVLAAYSKIDINTEMDIDATVNIQGKLTVDNITFDGSSIQYSGSTFINFQGDGATPDGDAHSVLFGNGGGATFIASGESGGVVRSGVQGSAPTNNTSLPYGRHNSTEELILASDSSVEIFTNTQSGYDHGNTRRFVFDNTGLNLGYGATIQHTGKLQFHSTANNDGSGFLFNGNELWLFNTQTSNTNSIRFLLEGNTTNIADTFADTTPLV